MATQNFRVGELEIKANNTSIVRGYNFDSRYYAKDKDAPSEDTVTTDWAPGGDPSVFTDPCTP